ncbi:MAG: carboxypeptidase-like regulatory domain-containing protein [Terriglobia bacterium]
MYGTITDSSGAVVPKTEVTARNLDTGIATKSLTDTSGTYNLLSLPPGTYNIVIEKQDFKSTVISGITLLVDQRVRLDSRLQVGDLATSVAVKGAAPLVETNTASVGTVIGTREVVDLPLNLRRFGALAILVPGTAPDNGGFAQSQQGSTFSETSYSANGARTASNNYLIDGVDARNLSFGGFSLQPPPDAVEEFKIQTNIYSAAFRKTAGSTINLVTKSGTNEIHGAVYEFLRNDKLDARNFFATDQTNPVTGADIPGSARPEYRRNQYGVAIGGPIRKTKTFWFFNYEGLREIQGLSLGSAVPTDAEKAGNFSSFLTGQTANLCGAGGPSNLNFDTGQLFAPGSESLYTCPSGSANAGGAILVGNPVSGNIISTIDPVAQKVVANFPEPNRPGFPNYINQQPLVRNDSQFDGRIDQKISDKDQFFARYLFGQSHIQENTLAYTTLPGFGDTIYYRGQNLALGWTHSFGGQLLNEAHFGFQRNWDILNCAMCPRGANFMEDFGIANLHALSPSDEGYPYFGFNNFAGIGDSGYRPVISPDMVEKYQDNLTWTRGRHTVVVGADMQFYQVLAEQSPVSPHGQFSYSGQYSSLAGEVPNVSGISDLADLLLGYPGNAADTIRYRNTNQVGGGFWAIYGQDDVKISSNLTLNLGLRWEYKRAAIDKRDNYVSFVGLGQKFSGPGNGILVTPAPNAENDSFCTDPEYSYLLTGDGRCLIASSSERAHLGFTGRTEQTLIFPDHRQFAPRVGIAWRPLGSDKLVVRTGYGIFYDLTNLNTFHAVGQNPVFSPTAQYSTAFGTPPPLTNGLPTTTENAFANPGVPGLNSQILSLYVLPNFVFGNVQQWSFGFQSQLAQNWALEVDYIGAKGTHLADLHVFGNQPEPGVGDLQPRRPYPDFSIMCIVSPDSNSSYQSLQAKLTKRFSTGMTFLGAYTFAHSIDDNEGDEGFTGGVGNSNAQDDNNRRGDRGRSYTDARQRFVLSYIWQLPVGSGRHFLNRTGTVNGILGGWEFTGIFSLQSGFPFSVQSSQDFSNTASTNPRPDRTCTGNGPKTVNDWFNTNCFTTAALEEALASGDPRFGNSGRNILNGPGLDNLDIALLKNFTLMERLNLQFRAESYDFFNRALFGPPNSSVGNPNIGNIGSAAEPRDIQFGLKLSF